MHHKNTCQDIITYATTKGHSICQETHRSRSFLIPLHLLEKAPAPTRSVPSAANPPHMHASTIMYGQFSPRNPRFSQYNSRFTIHEIRISFSVRPAFNCIALILTSFRQKATKSPKNQPNAQAPNGKKRKF